MTHPLSRSTMRSFFIGYLIVALTVPSGFCFRQEMSPEDVKAKAEEIGTGNKLELRDGSVLTGRISEVRDDGLTLALKDGTPLCQHN